MMQSKLIFPIWMLFIVPISWWTILPGIFIITLAAGYIACYNAHRRWRPAWRTCRKSLFPGCVALCVSYAVGVLMMLAPSFFSVGMEESAVLSRMSSALTDNIYACFPAALWALAAVAVSAFIAYFLGVKWIFRKSQSAKRMALIFAVISAPWLFVIPYKLYY